VPTPENIADYLSLAEDLYTGKISPEALPAASRTLPALTAPTLEALTRKIESASLTQPRLGWALAAVADAAARRSTDPFLQASAAYHLARAANDWVRPARVEEAVQRARAGFEVLGEDGWVAACDWQLYALPWTCNDYNQAIAVLAPALKTLEEDGFTGLAPHCRLSLAYAQILKANYQEATEKIAASEEYFAARGDRLNQARCWLHRSSALRRQGDFQKALQHLERALETFTQFKAPIERAKTYYQLAYCQTDLQTHYQAAEEYFHLAIDIFEAGDLPLWAAQCFNGLAQIYKVTGRLGAAGKLLARARRIFAQYEIYGLRADNLLDSGWFELYWGKPSRGHAYFTEAEKLYKLLGARQMVASAAMFQGRALTQLSRHQQAIQHLERAQEGFRALGNPARQAECDLFLGGAWIKLDRPERARQHLSSAAQYFKRSQQGSFLITSYLYQAEACARQQLWNEAVDLLQEALARSQKLGTHAQTALCRRLLGETLLACDEPQKAWPYLKVAVEDFEEMGIFSEKTASQVAAGQYYAQTSNYQKASATWEQVLASSEGVMPDIAWRASAGLAALAAGEGDHQGALEAYDRMVASLSRIRHGFWQPSLAGSYLRRASPAFDRAVTLAARLQAAEHTLRFIEESKAGTLLARFADYKTGQGAKLPPRLETLAVEVRRLQERLRVDFESPPGIRTASQSDLILQLRQKTRAYAELLARLERDQLSAHFTEKAGLDFKRASFREIAGHALGHDWVALDYYLTGTHLIGVTLTVDEITVWRREITTQVRLALDSCGKTGRGGPPPDESALAILGAFLLPPELSARLSRGTRLLLIPHKTLHQLPWAALPLGAAAQPLVTACIPVVIPSLQVLSLLLSRSPERQPDFRKGLLLALSRFPHNRPALPRVVDEREALKPYLSPQSAILSESAVTWENLQALAGAQGLARFAFWHIASHAFHDPLTGRLSGFALHDGDLWLDQLWEMAPLPVLVSISACSGTRSFVLEGDEHLGLAPTCLAAGAQHVVGSLWPVPDEAAAELMVDFYRQLWAGENPATALAVAQRVAVGRSAGIDSWGGFFCVGSPVT